MALTYLNLAFDDFLLKRQCKSDVIFGLSLHKHSLLLGEISKQIQF